MKHAKNAVIYCRISSDRAGEGLGVARQQEDCEKLAKQLGWKVARVIIDNCVHPDYRDALNKYFNAACAIGGHTPHVLREALSWHINLEETGHMLKD